MYENNEVIGTVTSEMEKINENIMEQLNDKLNKITAELSNERNNNNMLMESLTAALNKYQTLESEQKMREDISYREKLEKMDKDFKKTLAEKIDILKRYKID